MSSTFSPTGWAVQAAHFIFLSRRWAQDQQRLREGLAYFAQLDYPIQLLIFPEGTDLTPSNLKKSHTFSLQNGLACYNYVLQPRSTGFVHTVQGLAKGQSLPSILDLSVGYLGPIPQNERDIVAGRLPTEIHFHGRWITAEAVPQGQADLETWLQHSWQNKEQQLKQFYMLGQFEGPYQMETGLKQWQCRLVLLLVFWALYFPCLFYLLYLSPLLCCVFVALNAILFLVCNISSGLDQLVLSLQRHHTAM